MHRGPAGAGALNTLLQDALTPARPDRAEKRFGGRVFRVGDKVSQIRNNYDKGASGVFNGTQGVITAIDPIEQTLTVITDEDETIDYDFGELDELVHAYAVTVHRSQGSEYHCVVIPLTTSAWMMLQRNLLYTAVTRAKQLVVLVGSSKALGQAVRTTGSRRRHTALAHRLRSSRPLLGGAAPTRTPDRHERVSTRRSSADSTTRNGLDIAIDLCLAIGAHPEAATPRNGQNEAVPRIPDSTRRAQCHASAVATRRSGAGPSCRHGAKQEKLRR